MTRRPARPYAAAVCGALLAGDLLLGGLSIAPAGPVLQAVVTYDGPAVTVPGAHVVVALPGLHAAVVRGQAGALRRLAGTPGVRGLAPDDRVGLTGDTDRGPEGVLASRGLGGQAGRPGAGAGVRVAVVDTGVSDTAALDRASGRLVDAADASGVADGQPVGTGGRYDDGYGHGTFMAGLVAGGPVQGTGGRAIGVAPAATVLVVRVARPDGTTSLSQVLGGLSWVAEHADQVDVVNLSFSHQRPADGYGADPLTDAVERLRTEGVVVVASAGNVPGTVGDPGLDPQALTVGAADLATHRTASFSGSATVAGVAKPDLVASGVHLLGVLPAGSVLARDPGTADLRGNLVRGTGTSQATAVTSGLAALLLADHPTATPAQVKASLRCAARPLPGHRDGAGLARAASELCSGPDGFALDGSGDVTGEGTFDASSWAASSWAASSWAASSWAASSWAASSWAASSWAASSWAASSSAASSWAVVDRNAAP